MHKVALPERASQAQHLVTRVLDLPGVDTADGVRCCVLVDVGASVLDLDAGHTTRPERSGLICPGRIQRRDETVSDRLVGAASVSPDQSTVAAGNLLDDWRAPGGSVQADR